MLLLWLAACTQVSDPVPLQTIETLTGKWQQVDGTATLQFYEDETIKFVRPDENPPFRVLTLLENMKDGVGFSIGDRWTKPVRVELAEDGQHLTLVLPEKVEKRLLFVRSQ
jgi:hypothetical protein